MQQFLHVGFLFISVNPVHNAPVELPLARAARSFPARSPSPSPVFHQALPSPTSQNTPQGTSSDWKNLLGTAHTNRRTDIVTLIYKMHDVFQ